MNIESVEEAVHRGRPFTIKLADGTEFDIKHPDYMFIPPKGGKKRGYVVIHSWWDSGWTNAGPCH